MPTLSAATSSPRPATRKTLDERNFTRRSVVRGPPKGSIREQLILASSPVAEKAREGSRTVLLVTTDHGRASDFKNHGREHPESARVFLFAWGTEVAAARLVPAGARHLADIAPTLRMLFGLAPDRDPLAGRPLAGLFAGRPG